MNNKKRFKIGGVPEHFNLPWRLAIEEGSFDDLGVQLHWSDMTGGTGQMIKGLQTGSLDVAVLLTEGITKSILEGLEAKILMVYVTSPLHWGIHVPFDSDITKVEQLKNKTFAISREGSGSHLMTYVKAHQQGWPKEDVSFNVVGDVYGGLWALQHNEAQGFLWEKYTTFPYTEQKKCRYIDEVVTPWPCFVIAARTDIMKEHESELKEVCAMVHQKALELKQNEQAAEIISWRYNLRLSQVENWLKETNWNYSNEIKISEFEQVVTYLFELQLVSAKNCENWKQKLFS
ncbi:MAG TPA: ABC transporter substrate-binding protein [Crocinitomicaceae bacterium]|nr:ABC transporter substrate-binding protein [Flavobacteriales bacterium]HBW85223.1 ABC transporter substrate-binding protein [Crocinitomicaceae bacterium]